MHKVIRLLVLFICITAYPQQQEEAPQAIPPPYEAIDSHARSVTYKGDIALLTRELTANCPTQLEKARAIFVWITENVAYDYKQYNKGKAKRDNPPKCKKGEDCDAKMIKWETKYLDKVIRKKKEVCEGYSRLFKKMCDYAGIQGSLVRGYTKHRPEEVGKMGPLDHVWNVMLIDGKYYFVDVTWASGYCPMDNKHKLESFHKSFNDFYWLTSPQKLLINHFPKDQEWIRHMPYANAKEIYKAGPYIKGDQIKYMDIITPKPGAVKVNVGDTIHFRIKYTTAFSPKYLQISTNLHKLPAPSANWSEDNTEEIKRMQYTPFKQENDIYEFDYVVKEKNLQYTDILFDHFTILRFKIEVIQN